MLITLNSNLCGFLTIQRHGAEILLQVSSWRLLLRRCNASGNRGHQNRACPLAMGTELAGSWAELAVQIVSVLG